MNIIFISAFILGLTSSLHCIGMCGPIALIIPVNRKNNLIMSGQILLYNFGRILTYSILGIIIGSIGFTLQTFQILQWISIASGVLLIAFAWRKYLGHMKLAGAGFSTINKLYGKIAKSHSPFKLLGLGAVNGLLPCGMVYVAMLNAILAGNLVESGLAMAIFGLGTIPAMFFVSFSASKISSKARARFNVAIPYVLSIVGLLILLRGMNLGIPYISPEIQPKQSVQVHKKEQSCVTSDKNEPIKMDCCHSK